MRIRLVAFALGSISVFATTSPAMASPPERWIEARSAHFVVLTDANERAAQRIANQFERMHLVFHTLSPTRGDDSDMPITVIAVKDKKGLQALEPAAYLAKNQTDLAGFFLRTTDKNYILIRLNANESHAYSTVYHEYTHYMLRKADGWLPLWLNEGLAQFYENTDIDDKTVWLGETDVEKLRYLKRNDMLPIETLLTIDARSPYYHDEDMSSIFYSESWAMTHYLIVSDRIEGTHRVHDYCELLAMGEDSVTAARKAFGDLDKLRAGLDEYVMQRKFMYFAMPAQLAAKDATFEVRPVATSDADAVRADVLAYTGRSRDALALLETALRYHQDNELAHETMGYLRYRAGDVAGARTWYAEAVELAPHSYLAQYYFARMSLHSAGGVDDGKIESSLRTAIHLNAEFAPAYDELAMLYALRNRNLEEAHALNLRAIELDPDRLVYQLNCAEVLAEQRRFGEALGVLQGAMRLARTPYEVDAVTSRTERVERYQRAMGGSPKLAGSVSGFGR
jgi:tetratricopeptide (TPR) repeat protein